MFTRETELFRISKQGTKRVDGGRGDWFRIKFMPRDSINADKKGFRLEYKENGIAGPANDKKDIPVDELSGRILISYIREKLGRIN